MNELPRLFSNYSLVKKIGFIFLFAVLMILLSAVTASVVGRVIPLSTYSVSYLVQTLMALYVFFLPALLFAFLFHNYGEGTFGYLCQNRLPSVLMLAIAVLTILCAIPFINIMAEANHFFFPQDEEMYRRLNDMLTEGGLSHLYLRLLVVALVPAVTEEMFFRGLLQNTLMRHAPKWHAILVSAMIFSLGHADMSAFVPRFVLGAFLGWLLVIGKSLWLPIAVHFVNNAAAVICYYFWFDKQAGECVIDQLGVDNPLVAVVSFMLVVGGIFALHKLDKKEP